MKPKAILLALVVVILAANAALAAPSALAVPRSVLSGGGGRAVAGTYAVDGSIGQAIAAVVSAGPYRVCSGFWCGLGIFKLLLPIIFR